MAIQRPGSLIQEGMPTRLDDEAAEQIHRSLSKARRGMGLARLRIGALLCVASDFVTWEGRTGGTSFRRFLIEENIEPKAARQYMTVARVFVHHMHLTNAELDRIATASMRVLLKAAQVITEESREEVLSIVQALPRVEALAALAELEPALGPSAPMSAPPLAPPVRRILDEVDNLTFEQRADLYYTLGVDTRHKNAAAPLAPALPVDLTPSSPLCSSPPLAMRRPAG